jgi:multidrug efflux pump
MLCSLLLKRRAGATEAPPEEADEARRMEQQERGWFRWLLTGYRHSLTWVLGNQVFVLLIALGTFALTAYLYVVVPKGFFPVQDTGLIQAVTEAPQSISFAGMAERQEKLAAVILKDPDVVSLSSFIGADGSNMTLNSGRFLINLKERDQRTASAAQIVRRLARAAEQVEGIQLYAQPVQDLTIDTTVSRTQYQFVLRDANPAEFDEWVPKLVDRLQQLPELTDVASDYLDKGLAAYIEVDRATASRFGITPATIDNALYDAFGQRIVSTIFTQSSQYRVILEAQPEMQQTLTSLNSIYLPASGNGQVPLSALVTLHQQTTPLQVSHIGQFPAVTISFNLAQDVALGQAVDAITAAEQEIGLPKDILVDFQGATLAFQDALSNELLLIAAAIATVYIILGVLYESFIHPITILSTLPSAGIGALLALLIARQDLGIIAIIGIILLIGIVKKNAIMMIDFALDAERNQGKTPEEAIYQACLLRFRPILMTTMAALLGALPLMLGGGTGAELRFPLGVTIVGGLIVSQLLTLFTTPVIYLAFNRVARAIGWRHPQGAAS